MDSGWTTTTVGTINAAWVPQWSSIEGFDDENGTSYNDNSTSYVVDPWIRSFYRTVIPIMLIFCFVSIVTNVVIVISVRWVRGSLTPNLHLSISLAAADAYASLVIAVGLVYNSLLPVGYGTDTGKYHMCVGLAVEALRLTGMIASVLHLFALAIIHYVGIMKPLHSPQLITYRRTVLGIAFLWLLPLIFFFTYYSAFDSVGFLSPYCSDITFVAQSTYRVVVANVFFIPLVGMSGIYAHIFLIVHQRLQNDSQNPDRRQIHRNVKAIVTTLLILGTYLLGWVPAVIFSLLTCLDCAYPFTTLPSHLVSQLAFTFNTLIIIKSLVDPIVYAARMKEIRKALKRMRETFCPCLPSRERKREDTSRSRTDTLVTSCRYQSASSTRRNEHIKLVPQNSHSNDSSQPRNAQVVKQNGC